MPKSHLTRLSIICLICLISLGCAKSGEKRLAAGNDQLKIAFITCTVNAEFFKPVKKGMNDAAEAMDVMCDFMGTEGVDVKAQANMIRQAVRDGYNGIAVNIIDPVAFDEAIQDAMNKGVPVVGFNVDDHATPNSRLSSVNQQLYRAGEQLGAYVLSFIPENSRVLLTMHDKGVSALEDRLKGIQNILSTKKIQWDVIITGNKSTNGAAVIAEYLRDHPQIHIILGTGQSDTEAAGIAIEQNFDGKEYWSAGFDLSPKTLQLIKDGHIRCTVDQQPYIQGFYPVIQLTHYLRYGLIPSDMDAGAAMITKQNVEKVTKLTEKGYR